MDLGAHAELAAIGELSRGVDQHNRAVDLRRKRSAVTRLCHDRVGVAVG
jgi:hypothetical protein